MVVGALVSPISMQGIVNNVAGMGSYITSFFGRTAAPQDHTSNKAWSEPINGDAKGRDVLGLLPESSWNNS
jgi:hypothetical protein